MEEKDNVGSLSSENPMYWPERISVTVQERRAHPVDYGHYDCGVKLTYQINPGMDLEELRKLAWRMRVEARRQVMEECIAWERQIKGESSQYKDELQEPF